MSLSSITSMFEEFSLSEFVPDLFDFLSSLETLRKLALLIGPLFMLGYGIWFLFWPRKKVGHLSGFFAYYAMGSKEAWDFTQKMAGLIWTALGGGLLLFMGIRCATLSGEADQVIHAVMVCMFWQAGLALLSWLAIRILPAIFFDKDGNRKRE